MAKILIVDDEPLIAALVEEWLADMGHMPIGPAHSLEQARALLDGTPFDAAVVDLILGVESGCPIAEALASKGLPFLYATGCASGFDELPPSAGCLIKPFSFEGFKAAVERMLPGS